MGHADAGNDVGAGDDRDEGNEGNEENEERPSTSGSGRSMYDNDTIEQLDHVLAQQREARRVSAEQQQQVLARAPSGPSPYNQAADGHNGKSYGTSGGIEGTQRAKPQQQKQSHSEQPSRQQAANARREREHERQYERRDPKETKAKETKAKETKAPVVRTRGDASSGSGAPRKHRTKATVATPAPKAPEAARKRASGAAQGKSDKAAGSRAKKGAPGASDVGAGFAEKARALRRDYPDAGPLKASRQVPVEAPSPSRDPIEDGIAEALRKARAIIDGENASEMPH
jgi:hypothetical protein